MNMEKVMIYADGNPGPVFGQTQTCGGVKLVYETSTA
jgi:hypothetical protein